MGAHHTKDKGDLGTAKAFADLVVQGFMVLFPATEHAPFDLVAYRDGSFHRVQVKYRTVRAGRVQVAFWSYWADRHGTHMKPIDKSEVDVLCIYCPNTDECHYVRPADHRETVTLRVAPSRKRPVQGCAARRGVPGRPDLTHPRAPPRCRQWPLAPTPTDA